MTAVFKYLTFNGVSSETYGIKIWQPPNYTVPERDYEIVHIPGRNGDLIIDKNSYKNVKAEYTVSFGDYEPGSFQGFYNNFMRWLHGNIRGYAKLTDDYDTDHFRLASFHEAVDVVNAYNKAGQATIIFDCKPQRFLNSGDSYTTHSITKDGTTTFTIVNPTAFTAKPIFKFALGTVGVSDKHLTVTINNKYTFTIKLDSMVNVYLDSELMDVYSANNLNKNSDAQFNDEGFPLLVPGNNIVSVVSDGFGSADNDYFAIAPRWWTL